MNKNRLTVLSPSSGFLRRGKRCKVRRRNYVRREHRQINFSKDEDELILKLHALLGNRWSLIAGRLPGRTDNEISIHWETYLKRKLVKMGIDPTNHRLYHHTSYISSHYLDSTYKEHETNIISDQSSSVSETRDNTTLPISTTTRFEDATSKGQISLPDLNICLEPMKIDTSLPACFLQDTTDSSSYGTTNQETLLLFQ